MYRVISDSGDLNELCKTKKEVKAWVQDMLDHCPGDTLKEAAEGCGLHIYKVKQVEQRKELNVLEFMNEV